METRKYMIVRGSEAFDRFRVAAASFIGRLCVRNSSVDIEYCEQQLEALREQAQKDRRTHFDF